MRENLDSRELVQSIGPVVVAVLALATAPTWERRLSTPSPEQIYPLFVLSALGVLLALYAPKGRHTLCLGTLVLPPTIWFFGVSWAAWVGAGVYLLREIMRRLLYGEPLQRARTIRLLPTVADSARIALATLAGGAVWMQGLADDLAASDPGLFSRWGLLGLLVYGLVLLILQAIAEKYLRRSERWWAPEAFRSLGLDASGWILGVVTVRAVVELGWPETLLFVTAMALLAMEAARNVHLRQRAVARVSELWEVTRAGHRIIFRDPDLTGIARQVLDECRNVLPFHWFQFELLSGDTVTETWSAGPDGQIEEGTPQPAESPPALPGVHRRSSWKILGRELKGDSEPIARLRFWCDPRQLEGTSVDLLDSLLPQIAASVHRALLDRRAKQDPLTGLADRRVLEARLEQVYGATRESGGSMAVIMCDLDRFKKVNDNFGHEVGDRALLQVVGVLEEFRRDSDLCCRYGGEEFAVVLERTDGETALRVAERLRMEVERSVFMVGKTRVPLKLSAGVAAHPELQISSGKGLLGLADEALIEAKRRGRNRTLLHLGRGRFRTTDGKTVGGKEPPPPEIPTLF
jgi:diguanylate cyclase (GGDEF)-like protein